MNIMEETLYCIEILKEKHKVLIADSHYFVSIGRDVESKICETQKYQIEKIVRKLLAEICKNSNSISYINCSDELYDDYISLMNYFKVNFKKNKLSLEVELATLKDRLNSINGIFNNKYRKELLEKIVRTEVEIYKLNEILIKQDG